MISQHLPSSLTICSDIVLILAPPCTATHTINCDVTKLRVNVIKLIMFTIKMPIEKNIVSLHYSSNELMHMHVQE